MAARKSSINTQRLAAASCALGMLTYVAAGTLAGDRPGQPAVLDELQAAVRSLFQQAAADGPQRAERGEHASRS